MMPVHLSESHEAGKIADGFKFCHQGLAVHITVVILFADGIAYLFVTDLHNDTREIIGFHLFLLQDSLLDFFATGFAFCSSFRLSYTFSIFQQEVDIYFVIKSGHFPYWISSGTLLSHFVTLLLKRWQTFTSLYSHYTPACLDTI